MIVLIGGELDVHDLGFKLSLIQTPTTITLKLCWFNHAQRDGPCLEGFSYKWIKNARKNLKKAIWYWNIDEVHQTDRRFKSWFERTSRHRQTRIWTGALIDSSRTWLQELRIMSVSQGKREPNKTQTQRVAANNYIVLGMKTLRCPPNGL